MATPPISVQVHPAVHEAGQMERDGQRKRKTRRLGSRRLGEALRVGKTTRWWTVKLCWRDCARCEVNALAPTSAGTVLPASARMPRAKNVLPYSPNQVASDNSF
eukprot:6190373-Pleurochrysis_carterae.AAC.5